MKRYPAYRDSGVEWIGDIPKPWEILKLKFISKIANGSTPSTGNAEYWDGEIFWVTPSDISKIHDGKIVDTERKITLKGLQSCGTNLIPINSIILTTRAPIGNLAINKVELCTNQGCKSILVTYGETTFYYYQLLNFNIVLDSFGSGTTFKELSSEELKNYYVISPSLSEQSQIATFLDHKTRQIDDLIAKKQKLIELLKEERTALINQAVTKGLPTEVLTKAGLDPNVKMKDSGVEWLGEIPEHWKISKFNYYINLRHGFQFRDNDFTEAGIKIVKITQLNKDGYLDLSSCSFINSNRLESFSNILINQNDILMCLTGGTIGKIIRVGKVNEPLLQNYRVGHFSSNNSVKMTNDYIFWLMTSDVVQEQINFFIRETGQPNIGMEDFTKMMIQIPPIKEQIQISVFLYKKISNIIESINRIKREIELLNEYKTSLINEAVTGKIDVRNYETK